MDCSSVFMAAIYAVLVSLLFIWTTTEANLIVNTTFLESSIAKGAVCLDGSAPAFNFHPGTGSGVYSWLIQLQGGGWCDSASDCQDRATKEYGTSKNISKISYFMGVLSNDSELNPDFYDWNRVKIRYCDGSSYTGDIEEVDPATNLHFRGARIFKAIMEELLYHKGMIYAENAILSGTSAGGLGAILHCDKFRLFFSLTARVKCISDAGFFINAKTITGEPHIKEYFKRVVTLHGSAKNLPLSCTFLSLDPSVCFFPQYAAQHICTPLFIINSAYDSWQINNILVPEGVADPQHVWDTCKKDINKCSPSQIQTLQEFRSTFLEALNELGPSISRGYFISSCHFHHGIEIQSYWSNNNSPTIANKTIAEAVGDWFVGRSGFQGVYCPYPCGKFCQ
ncbi:pectin acetylesterase 8-like [Nicotiana sylvestris]|uniref:Pectin acetylesterase n=1 Tax=Nicotiana sylvestris TaxID=4096 RepID=A0A1U7XPN6_NICSY|nr:PREDICTED: uncharacterized protein LOC104240572 [Nicotiana sylvestris]